jgi:hypothetical protein
MNEKDWAGVSGMLYGLVLGTAYGFLGREAIAKGLKRVAQVLEVLASRTAG